MLAIAAPAMADASAWVFVGGGALGWRQAESPGVAYSGTMTFDVGVGTDPKAPFIFGGLFRIQPVFENGVDLALLTRFCTRGFQGGDWGVAVDVGGFARPWGIGSAGFSGDVSLGLPLGFQLTAMTEIGVDRAYSVGLVAGIDVLRLTLYRQVLKNWWQNPAPAWTTTKTAESGEPLVRF